MHRLWGLSAERVARAPTERIRQDMQNVTVSAMQMGSTDDYDTNMATADRLIRAAAMAGAQIVLPGETFSSHEFQFMEMDSQMSRLRLR